MTKEEFIQQIKNIKVNVPDEYFFLDYNKIVYNILDANARLQQEKDNLIKYLENKIKQYKNACIGNLYSSKKRIEYEAQISAYEDILERIKNNNYE